MKSIKEKSEEYGLQYPVIRYDASGNPCDDVDKPSIDFESGANYVLDKVEYILEDKDFDCEEICDSLFALIEQLRK